MGGESIECDVRAAQYFHTPKKRRFAIGVLQQSQTIVYCNCNKYENEMKFDKTNVVYVLIAHKNFVWTIRLSLGTQHFDAIF